MTITDPTEFAAALFTLTIALLGLDILAALWLSGRLTNLNRATAVVALALVLPHGGAEAQDNPGLSADDELALIATAEITLENAMTVGSKGVGSRLAELVYEKLAEDGLVPVIPNL